MSKTNETLSDSTLVLLGHGSTKNEDSSAAVRQHAAELRQRRLFADVREAFWKQEPQIKAVLTQIATPRIFIVPLFISEGYFSENVIPKSLGFATGGDAKSRITRHESRSTHYARVVGTHDRMTTVLLARAREVVAQSPFPRAPKPKDTALLIAGHGTEQNQNSRQAVERQVERIRAMKEYAEVYAIYMEEEPRIGAAYSIANARNLIVVPFFISDGLHVREDIPVLLGEPERVVRERLAENQPTWRNPTERNGRLVWYSRSVGTDPQIAEVILERVREFA